MSIVFCCGFFKFLKKKSGKTWILCIFLVVSRDKAWIKRQYSAYYLIDIRSLYCDRVCVCVCGFCFKCALSRCWKSIEKVLQLSIGFTFRLKNVCVWRHGECVRLQLKMLLQLDAAEKQGNRAAEVRGTARLKSSIRKQTMARRCDCTLITVCCRHFFKRRFTRTGCRSQRRRRADSSGNETPQSARKALKAKLKQRRVAAGRAEKINMVTFAQSPWRQLSSVSDERAKRPQRETQNANQKPQSTHNTHSRHSRLSAAGERTSVVQSASLYL